METLTGLQMRNFTVFSEANLEFAPGLNVIVGTNGTGKTHVLKLAYSILAVTFKAQNGVRKPTATQLQTDIAQKLLRVFKPDHLGRLVRRSTRGRQSAEVECRFHPAIHDTSFTFNTASEKEVKVAKTPSAWIDKRPVYLPTRELLTIYPGFVSLYENSAIPFEETWRDTCSLLGFPLARGPREKTIKKLLVPLEEAIGGKVELKEPQGFYLNQDGVRTEMHLVAEGLRKLATIVRLIATGQLIDNGYLLWDEPESNLNPKIVKVVAKTILELCKVGIQVFVATHSLFLMRELDILLRGEFKDVKSRFFGLHPSDKGVTIQQGDTVDDIGSIDSLDEELMQSDRYRESVEVEA